MRQGAQIGHYEVLALIGKGGMGEVWKARDRKLQRDVAIKALPDEFVRDAERLSRFEREARLLASVNHPHIATIHGLEESGDSRFLILELIDGETLADQLKRGAVSEDESLQIALQIAQALEAAHEKGVVHRDLKPANVKITPEGRVKVLDFGLAKIHEPYANSQNMSHSPTLSALQTGAGVILGTAAYMSPEQARGKNVDRRADIWAFGCLLYEMLTGRQAFPNEETVSDTLAGILKGEPDWKALPARTPARIRTLLERCLRKDPRRRLPDIGAARIEIEDALATPEPIGQLAAAAPRRNVAALGASIAALLIAVFLAIWVLRTTETEAPVARFDLLLPGLISVNPTGQTLSPDGKKLAIVAGPSGDRRIWIRPLDSTVAQPLAATDGAERLAWSANSEHVAFFAQGKLKRIPVVGGPPVVLAELSGRDLAWNADDVILIGGQGKGLMRMSAAGGPLEQVTASAQK
jgi:tRNA A-37 threonylcarbamoyl transferase component Bud32